MVDNHEEKKKMREQFEIGLYIFAGVLIVLSMYVISDYLPIF